MKYLTGNSAQQSSRMTEALQDDLAGRFQRVLEAEIARVANEMIDQYEMTRSAPVLPLEHEARMAEIFAHMASLSITTFGNRILDQSKASGLILETKSFAEMFARFVQNYIADEAIRARITSISNTVRDQIINQISAGQESGEGIAVIAKTIRERVPIISRFRSEVIARTEIHNASNYGIDEAAKATGLQLRKEWVAAGDARTRSDHRSADGQVVDMDQPFVVGGERLMYPGDRRGSAEQTINCRCSVAHVVVD